MLDQYFRWRRVCADVLASPAGPYLEDLTTALVRQGFGRWEVRQVGGNRPNPQRQNGPPFDQAGQHPEACIDATDLHQRRFVADGDPA